MVWRVSWFTTLLAAGGLAVAPVQAALPDANPGYEAGFPKVLNGAGIRYASIAVGDLDGDGEPEVVVGASDGTLYALHGNGTLMWSLDTGSMAIEGKPAIGDVDGDGLPEVVIGTGSTFPPAGDGRLLVVDNAGTIQCPFDTMDVDGNGLHDGVFSSPALADLDGDGQLDIVFGAWDHRVRAIHGDCSLIWARAVYDTVWSSPAIGDIDHDGRPEVVIGADSHYEPQPIGTEDGGRLLVFNGEDGTDVAGFPIQIDEVISSSPALADLDGDGWLDIVVGTGNCWGVDNGCGTPFHAGVGEYVNAWNHLGQYLPGWPKPIPGEVATGSPAVADIDGDGDLEVVINSMVRATGDGHVWALEANGSVVPGWPVTPSTPADCSGGTVHYATSASPVLADLDGDGLPEILLPSNGEIVVWDHDGNQRSRPSLEPPVCSPPSPDDYVLATGWSVAGTPALADIDGDGDLEVIAGGYVDLGVDQAAVWAWDFATPARPGAPWPVFRAGTRNLGQPELLFVDGFDAGTPSRWDRVVP